MNEIQAERITEFYFALDFSEPVLVTGKYPDQLEIKNK
jgi:hypothetical protein